MDRLVDRQGMGAARLAEAANQHLLVGLEEEKRGGEAPGLHVAEDLREVLQEVALAHVDDERRAAELLGLAQEVDEPGNQGGREVVDAEPADVLEGSGDVGLPRAREARDQATPSLTKQHTHKKKKKKQKRN